ncbi:MAG: methyltransferase domain-containing protein [Bacteroidota bacterium]
MTSIKEFYDSIANDYDSMTDIEKRFVKERPYYHLMVDKYKIKKALDAGCGTGFHSLLLSKLGVSVTAIDISNRMLAIFKKQAIHLRLNIAAHNASMLHLPPRYTLSFDAVFCLGNTLPHLSHKNDLQNVIRNFSNVLKPGGVLILQILNYQRILRQQSHFQTIKITGDTTYIRTHRYDRGRLLFEIEEINTSHNANNHSVRRIELQPFSVQDLKKNLLRFKFEEIKIYGTISMQSFESKKSQDLVIHARKRNQ